MKIVAVTSCPTGIAHTYMAAEALEEAARQEGIELTVETQGAAGATPLDPAVIAAADAVIFAADVEVRNRDRFAGKPTIEAPVKQAINGAQGLIAQARAAAAAAPATAPASGAPAAPVAAAAPATVSFRTHLRQWLMTGVSYMIPFVAAGGILIAISFVWGGAAVANKVNGGTFQGVTYTEVTDLSKLVDQAGWAGLLFKIGSVTFAMLVPVLAGYIAYAMVDRPGLVPGIVAGLLANLIGAGFLGGLIGGLLAGGIVMLILKVQVPKAVRGIMPVIIIPLLATMVVGVLMIVVIGQPIATATTWMTDWLNSLGGTNAVLLGLLLGAMMGFDMGGPVNKVAYTFGIAGLTTGNQTVMAAVMVAGMTPPIGLALATVLRRSLFTRTEREAGDAAWLLGASFVTEGALPFAAADPVRVIPSVMAGSALAGALSMGFGVTSPAPHGGIWVIGLVGNPLLWLVALGAGTALTTACVIAAKSMGHAPTPNEIELDTPVDLRTPAASTPAGARLPSGLAH
jgi:PTS system fructose-specific IIC component